MIVGMYWDTELSDMTPHYVRFSVLQLYGNRCAQVTVRWVVPINTELGCSTVCFKGVQTAHILSPPQVKKLSECIFSGLAYLHRTIHAGARSKIALAHGDVRSDNILLKPNYVPVLGEPFYFPAKWLCSIPHVRSLVCRTNLSHFLLSSENSPPPW